MTERMLFLRGLGRVEFRKREELLSAKASSNDLMVRCGCGWQSRVEGSDVFLMGHLDLGSSRPFFPTKIAL
jgi:hypothetical protein